MKSEQTRATNCPVCDSAVKKWRSKKTGSGIYNIDICVRCGFAFVNPRPSLEELMVFYAKTGHGKKEGEASLSAAAILAQETSDPNSTIDAGRIVRTVRSLTNPARRQLFLDVGCGYGFFARGALNAGFSVVALEMAAHEREVAQQIIGQAPVASSFEEFEGGSGSFDVVCMSQTLEHALDVNLWMEKAHRLLADDGLVVIALPNFGSLFRLIMQENEPYICPPAHLNYFNPASLSRLLAKNGFKVEAKQWITRIPAKTFAKRIPFMGKPLLPVIKGVSAVLQKMIDACRLGMMVNVYARKTKG